MYGGFLSHQRAMRQSKTKQNRNPFWAVGCDLVRETEEPQGAETQSVDWNPRWERWRLREEEWRFPRGDLGILKLEEFVSSSQLGLRKETGPCRASLVVWSGHSQEKLPRLSNGKPPDVDWVPPCSLHIRGRYPDSPRTPTGKMKSRGNLEPGCGGHSPAAALMSLWARLLGIVLECPCFLLGLPCSALPLAMFDRYRSQIGVSELKEETLLYSFSPSAWLLIEPWNLFFSWLN